MVPPKVKTARRPQCSKGARDVMTYEATQLRLVSLPPAGAAALEARGAGVHDLVLQLSHLHRTDAKYTCQLVEGLLP
jgi:hypothetical protein